MHYFPTLLAIHTKYWNHLQKNILLLPITDSKKENSRLIIRSVCCKAFQGVSAVIYLVHSFSVCTKHWLLQLKILHRIYYTNARLAKMHPNLSYACNRCNQSPATLMHMFWTCPRLLQNWTEIFTYYTRIKHACTIPKASGFYHFTGPMCHPFKVTCVTPQLMADG